MKTAIATFFGVSAAIGMFCFLALSITPIGFAFWRGFAEGMTTSLKTAFFVPGLGDYGLLAIIPISIAVFFLVALIMRLSNGKGPSTDG